MLHVRTHETGWYDSHRCTTANDIPMEIPMIAGTPSKDFSYVSGAHSWVSFSTVQPMAEESTPVHHIISVNIWGEKRRSNDRPACWPHFWEAQLCSNSGRAELTWIRFHTIIILAHLDRKHMNIFKLLSVDCVSLILKVSNLIILVAINLYQILSG